MNSLNMNHIDVILDSVYRPEKVTDFCKSVDPIILRSWKRCVTHFNLEPSATRGARVLTNQELLDYRTPVEDFIHIAKAGLKELHKQVAALDYVILLTDKHGITVEYIGNEKYDKQLRASGLYLGSDWNEMHAGTCGVGICATEMQPVTAHHTDHFDVINTALTCSAAPIYDPAGQPLAVLDVSSLNSPTNKQSQHLLLEIVKLYAQIIESANFLHHYNKNHWIVRFGSLEEYVNVNAPNMIAIDETGMIEGINSSARFFLNRNTSWQDKSWDEMIGKNITSYFDCSLEEITNNTPGHRSCIKPVKLNNLEDKIYFSSTTPLNAKYVFTQNSQSPRRQNESFTAEDLTSSLSDLAGTDHEMQKSIKLAKKLLNSNINFLIQGETGSGKEVFAKAIHNESARHNGPFVAVNCAAIPESLIESELFGYKPGSFTGARSKGSQGLIQQSSGGTLFLDEIGDMPLNLQTRLLRVLSEQEVMPLGSDKAVSVDLNVISASHRSIETMIHNGDFREDLYFRLAGATLRLSPLRERQDKDYIINRVMIMESGNADIEIDEDVIELLCKYHWPGNIRELRNILRVTFAFSDKNTITRDDLPEQFIAKLLYSQNSEHHAQRPVQNINSGALLDPKVEFIVTSLKKNKWNITETANELNISRATIYRKMKKYNIVPPNNLDY